VVVGRSQRLCSLRARFSINVRVDQSLKRMRELNIFSLAAHGAVPGQKSFFEDIGKQFRIGAVSHRQQIEEGLRRCAVLVGERLLRHRHRRGR
jgi:hypothetical protein